jgi:hypothetical protein
VEPLVKGALAVAALALVGAAAARLWPPPARGPATLDEASSAEELARMPCGPRELPEGDACVPIPGPPRGSGSAAALDPPLEEAPGARIPRRPDRPADVRALALPIEGEPTLVAPADDDLTVLRLGAPAGSKVLAAPLRDQDGPFEILAIETLPGRGLVVAAKAASIERGKGSRWLVLWGSLDGAGPGLEKGAKPRGGDVVGFAGDSASPGLAHVRFEVRKLRTGTEPDLPLATLVTDAESIAVDARNVLAPR